MSLISCKNCGRQISDMAETCPHCGEKTNDEQKTYSKEIYDLFIEGLNTYTEFNYNENTQEGTIIVPQVGIDASLKSVSTIINIRDFDCVIVGIYDNFRVPSEHMSKVCELLMRINNFYIYPQWILEFDDNSIVCQYRHQFSGELLDPRLAVKAFADVGVHLQKCANAILSVALGLQEPEVAINSIEIE